MDCPILLDEQGARAHGYKGDHPRISAGSSVPKASLSPAERGRGPADGGSDRGGEGSLLHDKPAREP